MSNFKMKRNGLTRRQFLRGVYNGVPLYLAMPTLTSLLPREALAADGDPMNFFFMFLPNGTFPHSISSAGKIKVDDSMSRWFPSSTGNLPATLPIMLKKLEGNIQDFSLISGFRAPVTSGNVTKGPHASSTRMLTANTFGATNGYSSASAMMKAGYSKEDSIDQLIAKKLANSSAVEEMQKYSVFSRMRIVPAGDDELRPWTNQLSFYDHKPAFSYTSPQKLFEAIFGSGIVLPPEAKQGQINALDFLMADIKKKRDLASAEDKQTLERWVTGYEDMKTKISNLSASLAASSSSDSCPGKPTKPDSGLNSASDQSLLDHYDDILNAFLDIYLAAMECGARRVFTLTLLSESGGFSPFHKALQNSDLHSEASQSVTLGQMGGDPHQTMAHYGEDGSPILDYLRLVSLNNYFMRKYKYVIDGMKSRGIFNNSLAISCYGTRDGNHTSGDGDFPFLVAGGGGGFKKGKHHRLTNLAPHQVNNNSNSTLNQLTPVDNFWVSVLAKYGINYNSAHATGNLNQLFG